MTALTLALTTTSPPALVMPVDPESLDATRPPDLDTCSHCMGDGAISVRVDGEWTTEACWSCHGTGQRGAA